MWGQACRGARWASGGSVGGAELKPIRDKSLGFDGFGAVGPRLKGKKNLERSGRTQGGPWVLESPPLPQSCLDAIDALIHRNGLFLSSLETGLHPEAAYAVCVRVLRMHTSSTW